MFAWVLCIQVCVQVSTSAVNVALPTFAAACRAVSPCCCSTCLTAINLYCYPPGPQQLHAAAVGEWDRQTDGHRTVK